MMNYVVDAQQNRVRLSSRVAELREEIKMRIANKASAEGTFDKIIECYAALTTLAKETSIAHRNWTDPMWRRTRNDALDVLLELLNAVEPSKPLRAQIVTQGRAWLSEFDDYELWRDVMVYCYVKRFRQGLAEIHFNTIQFSDEDLERFAREKPEEIERAYIYGMSPNQGTLLPYPLAKEGAMDHWNYMQKLLQFTVCENDATSRPDQLPDERA
jgi:hypothetical protein